MNTKDVDNYNIDQTEFERYLEKKSLKDRMRKRKKKNVN
mgnify:CR=1 FL=1